MVLHEKPYTKSDLWWILYKVFYNEKPIGTWRKLWYYNVPCAFDIETSSFIYDNEKCACMYIWMLGLGGYCIVGRTWYELEEVLDKVSEYCSLTTNVILPIYVHNLAFEFQFIKDRFEWDNVFSLDTRKPNYARTVKGIEFRCSYQLSGYSLAKVGENLQTYDIKKMDGDLDYSLIRNSKTPLSDKEMSYCVHDVLVVMAYIQECIDQEGNITNIPQTKTGYVRRYVKRKCIGTSKHRNQTYRNAMKFLTLSTDEYKQLRRAFQGGFTHANATIVGDTLFDVDSYDFTSSYPTVMLSEQFPMSSSKMVDIHSKEELEEYCELYCCLFDVCFYNLQSRYYIESYLSTSHCVDISNGVFNNGRLVSADYVITTVTEQDYKIIKAMYTWDSMQVNNFRCYQKDYLPKEFMDAILTLYENKTQLKDVKGKEVEYMQSKANLNSLYGMTVTDICRDEDLYIDGEWLTNPVDIDKAIAKYNKATSRFMFYPWGVWVTAYSRVNLFTGILNAGHDYVYCDTDSIKMRHGEEHLDYIETYNKLITRKIEYAMEYRGFPNVRTRPKTIEGVEKPIGVWDYEGHYKRFKTLGAKRYLWEDENGNQQMTVAGLSKQDGLRYMQETNPDVDVFDKFNNGLYIPKGKTGKRIHVYVDYPVCGTVIDYLGNEAEFNELSCLYLEDADYSLSMGEQFMMYLMGLKDTYEQG